MYQSGTKPQPPMKSGDEWAWVAAMMMFSGLSPSESSAARDAVSCLIPQSLHLLA